MKMKAPLYVILVMVSTFLVSCGPSQADQDDRTTQIAADVFATQTAEAPSATATLPPTATFTPTILPTPEPSSTSTSPPESGESEPSSQAGLNEYLVGTFHISLPERWTVVDVKEEGIEAMWSLLEGLDTKWAENITAMVSTEAMAESLVFWAMDTVPAGSGFPTVNIVAQTNPVPVAIADLCAVLPSTYKQIGLEVVDFDCNLNIHAVNAARFTIRINMGSIAVKQFQYIFLQGSEMWVITLAVDESEWTTYESLFEAIGESFRLVG